MKKIILTLIIVSFVRAQSLGDKACIFANNINLAFNNKGFIGDVYVHPYECGEQYMEGSFLYLAGFWLSGYVNDSLWATTHYMHTFYESFQPGCIGMNPDDSLASIYKVTATDKPFGTSWTDWIKAVELGAEFYDGDDDGEYNPVDKNWNGTWDENEDMPGLLGDESLWCVFNDGVPKENRGWIQFDPLGIEIRQTIFASDVTGFENTIFIKYSILNKGLVADFIDSVYFGIKEDGDLGDETDDVVGCDTLLNSSFYYNNNPDVIYGENCPAFYTTLLQGPIVKTGNVIDTAYNNLGELLGRKSVVGSINLSMSSSLFFIHSDPDLRDPINAEEVRNYLLALLVRGGEVNPCYFPYGEVLGGVDCNLVNEKFWVSGDPVINSGWICSANSQLTNMINVGPFQLEKDKPQEIIIAYVLGRGTDYFNSITVARENVQRAIAEYESNFASMTYSAPPPTNPVTSYVLYQNYPNPFNPTTTIRYELPQDGIVTLEIYDILGQKVRTILNEFKRADRYEVNFDATGLASGIYIYQLKVNEFITSKKMVFIK